MRGTHTDTHHLSLARPWAQVKELRCEALMAGVRGKWDHAFDLAFAGIPGLFDGLTGSRVEVSGSRTKDQCHHRVSVTVT